MRIGPGSRGRTGTGRRRGTGPGARRTGRRRSGRHPGSGRGQRFVGICLDHHLHYLLERVNLNFLLLVFYILIYCQRNLPLLLK